jgi:uncharacterized protein YndB with AHSA1/START domain
MPITKEASGRRSVESEVEVNGTPEQVWEAIASGPGISSWFVPSTLEQKVGGRAASSFAPDGSMDSVGTITSWEPPQRFVVETEGGPGTVASEWTVAAHAGGTCTVRVVHSWFASTDDWDEQFEGHTWGWLSFFAILRLYLKHFRGRPGVPVQLMAMSTGTPREAWDKLVRPLGLADASVGARVATPAGAPRLGGVAEIVNPPAWPGMILRLDEPTPALAHLFAMPMGGSVMLPVRFYCYGAAEVAKDVETEWKAWLAARFPPA